MQNQIRRACAYVRVSKEREDGISPEQQKDKAELQAKLLGLDLLRIYQDIDISGRSDRRPAFQEMIKDIKAGQYDVCLIYKLDRFCRNVKDFHFYTEIMESHGCSLVSISQNIDTSTPVGRLLRNILADFAQFESEMIAERVKDNKAAAARKGRWSGGHVPFGYVAEDKKLEINQDEATLVRMMFERRLKGAGFLKIAKELTALGIKPRRGTRRGNHWSEDSVRYIIENPIYKGILEYDDVSLEGAMPLIVDEDTWDQAQVQKKIHGRAQQSPHLLSGLLHCTHCNHMGWTIVANGRVYTGKDGTLHGRLSRYMCRTKRDRNSSACATRLLDKISLEARIVETVYGLADQEIMDREIEKVRAETVTTGDNNNEVQRTRSELENTRSLMVGLFTDYYDHRMITRDQFAKKNAEYLEREKLLSDRLEELEVCSPARAIDDIKMVMRGAAALREDWEIMTDIEKRLALRQVISKIIVYPDRVEVDFFGIKKAIAPKIISDATLLF